MATHSLPGESHGQRGLVCYSPQGCKELDMSEATLYTCTQTLRHKHSWNGGHIRWALIDTVLGPTKPHFYQEDQQGSLGCSPTQPSTHSSLRISGHYLDTRNHPDIHSGLGGVFWENTEHGSLYSATAGVSLPTQNGGEKGAESQGS